MSQSLPIQHNVSLRAFNSFGIDAKASAYLRITDPAQLNAVRSDPALMALPRLVLGGGSNILLTRDFPGLVLHMATRGMEKTGEDAKFHFIRAAAGENWHELVMWSLKQGLGGLENLSLIPGSVGAAPVQNIGAYGAEISDVVHAIKIFDFETGETQTLGKADCAFAYRDSLFKHDLRDRAVILNVTLALPKKWQPNTNYIDVAQELAVRGISDPNAREMSDAVIAIRTRKLPESGRARQRRELFQKPGSKQ